MKFKSIPLTVTFYRAIIYTSKLLENNMKKIIPILLLLVFLTSCASHKHTFEKREDGTVTMDSAVFYPLENSHRFTDYGMGKKQGAVLGQDVYIPEGEDTVLLLTSSDSDTYYVPESLKSFDKLLEECKEFFFVPASQLDRNGRVSRKYAQKAKRLTGEDATDFAFYVFYGRAPQDYGYKKCTYAGEVYGVFPELDSLVSSYSVYRYDSDAYSIVIDGEEYLMDLDTAEMIGIIK